MFRSSYTCTGRSSCDARNTMKAMAKTDGRSSFFASNARVRSRLGHQQKWRRMLQNFQQRVWSQLLRWRHLKHRAHAQKVHSGRSPATSAVSSSVRFRTASTWGRTRPWSATCGRTTFRWRPPARLRRRGSSALLSRLKRNTHRVHQLNNLTKQNDRKIRFSLMFNTLSASH